MVKNKIKWILLALAALVGIVSVMFYVFNSMENTKDTQQKKLSDLCSPSQMEFTAEGMDIANPNDEEFKELATEHQKEQFEQIKKEPQYKSNIDCLYMLTVFHLENNQLQEAKKEYETLVSLHEEGEELSEEFKENAIEDIGRRVEGEERQRENFIKTSTPIPGTIIDEE